MSRPTLRRDHRGHLYLSCPRCEQAVVTRGDWISWDCPACNMTSEIAELDRIERDQRIGQAILLVWCGVIVIALLVWAVVWAVKF